MSIEIKHTPKVDTQHSCCFSSPFKRRVHPIELQNLSHNNTLDSRDQQRKNVEAFVFRKLEAYSKKKLTNLFQSTSLSHVRRRLKRDIKSFSKEYASTKVSDEKFDQWIDEILDEIQLHISQLRSIFESQSGLENFLKTDKIFSSKNINNQWKQLQLKQAKTVLTNNNSYDNDEELLLAYQRYVLEKLTPKQLENNKNSSKNREKIDLDEEYKKAEDFGREYLQEMLFNYEQRQRPNLKLIQEMINLGMKQMSKRPKKAEFSQASTSTNILDRVTFILKSKRSYSLSLQNIADDFMLLRFGHSLDNKNTKNDAIRDQFIGRIHMFLNTISLLVYLFNANIISDSLSPSSLFCPFNSDLPTGYILEPTVYIDEWTWLLEKWKTTLQIFPIELTNQGAFSRLVRTTVGVGISRIFSFTINNEEDELNETFFQALQMGFYYGIAYALVDGLQDSQYQHQENFNFDKWFEKAEHILCGEQFNPSSLPKLPITPLFLETFHSLVQLTSTNGIADETFTDLALLLRSQRLDKKTLENPNYDDVDLYLAPLLKSHFTYTATAFMGGVNVTENRQRLWLTPFLGQLTDDCRDFDEDYQAKSITPVTYFVQHNGLSLNPFFVFLFVCEDLFQESNRQNNTGAFLGRRIMRTLRTLGSDFKKFLNIFTEESYPELYKYMLSLEDLFQHVGDPEKAMFRHMNVFARNYSLNHRKLETFAYDCLPLIENELLIKTDIDDPLVHGMNYSLKAGGKRLRPLLLILVGQLYNIEIKHILPLARAIEYLHTSSLIFDDLPAQDNAPLRRGQVTLHRTIESDSKDIPLSLAEGRAQLAAVNLIAHAIQSVTMDLRKERFSSDIINDVTAEIAQSMSMLCYGQFLDLQYSRTEKSLTIVELDRVAYFKTGKAIEIALICPAILSQQKQPLDRLRELSRLMGILFQMRDDLLDVEGHGDTLGKLNHIDQQNKTVTYITLLGIQVTRKRIANMRKQVESILNDLWPQAGTIQDLIQYICEREK